MAVSPKANMSELEYVEFERTSPLKHEYFRGEVSALGGASYAHVVIAGNMGRRLGNQLDGRPCTVGMADLRVKVAATGLFTYPDLVVTCGTPQLIPPGDTLTNPVLIAEILSDSTEKNDRGWKFEQYQQIESLREYLLVAQDTPRLELFRRQDDGRWLYQSESRTEASIELASIGCSLKLADVYEKVAGLREKLPPYRG